MYDSSWRCPGSGMRGGDDICSCMYDLPWHSPNSGQRRQQRDREGRNMPAVPPRFPLACLIRWQQTIDSPSWGARLACLLFHTVSHIFLMTLVRFFLGCTFRFDGCTRCAPLLFLPDNMCRKQLPRPHIRQGFAVEPLVLCEAQECKLTGTVGKQDAEGSIAQGSLHCHRCICSSPPWRSAPLGVWRAVCGNDTHVCTRYSNALQTAGAFFSSQEQACNNTTARSLGYCTASP